MPGDHASPWNISQDILLVGDDGNGTLTIGADGTVTSTDGIIRIAARRRRCDRRGDRTGKDHGRGRVA
ncbi:hypothetical protein [Mesorhizobium xinjiangense]|uniref:hypothetical protein n=1 Tax=Mesorhizobium xinjiangense TaxID=2678685 RepID=UPI0018DEB659